MGKKLIIMVCIAAMIMTNLPDWDAGADVSGTAPSEAGDTLIGNATVWKNEIITLNGNLTVNETGSLTLDNVTLLMNCAQNGSYHIEVQTGGEMHIYNSTITSTNESAHYNFWVRTDSKFEMRDSELHGCGYEWGENGDHGGLWINTNNVTLDNNTLSNNFCGLSFFSSSDGQIANCNIYSNSQHGIYSSSSNNRITNCTIYNNNGGIYLYSSSNNTVTTNQIYNNSYDGIGLIHSSNNNLNANCVYNNFNGIYLYYSSSNDMGACNIYNNTHGINPYYSSNNNINTCNIYGNQFGIILFDSLDTNINACNIYNNYYGVYLDTSSSDNIISTTDVYNNYYGIYLYNASTNHISNSTITNSSNYDFYLVENSSLCTLNTSFNKTKVYFEDNASTLNVSWYLNMNVKWKNNISAEYANIIIFDNLTNEVFNGSTDKNGLINDIIIQEYTQNQTNTTSFTPHNVTASQGYISIWDDNVTVNETKTVELVLDHNAPVINYTTVSPEQEYSTDENTTVEFSFNVSHPDNLTLIYYWYLNGNETFNTTLENTASLQKINWTCYFNFTSHGNYTVKVMVSDGNATVSCEWVLTVNDVNGRPWITCFYPPKDIVLGNLSCVIFNVTASDPDNDALSYQWMSNGKVVSDQAEYILYAEYNASGNNTYIIEIEITDGKLSDNHTWAVVVVDLNASYNNLLLQIEILKAAVENITKLIGNITETLLNQTELLENITRLVENITALNMTVLKDKLDQLFAELENLNVTLAQLNENLTRIQEELNNATDKIGNLTAMLESANASRDQAIDNETMALNAKENAENAAAAALKEKEQAITAKNKAESKLAGSVVLGVIGGVIAGFLISFLLRRKLPKKG